MPERKGEEGRVPGKTQPRDSRDRAANSLGLERKGLPFPIHLIVHPEKPEGSWGRNLEGAVLGRTERPELGGFSAVTLRGSDSPSLPESCRPQSGCLQGLQGVPGALARPFVFWVGKQAALTLFT